MSSVVGRGASFEGFDAFDALPESPRPAAWHRSTDLLGLAGSIRPGRAAQEATRDATPDVAPSAGATRSPDAGRALEPDAGRAPAPERPHHRRLTLRRVEHIMGTAISLDLRDPGIDGSALDDVFAHLREVDLRFSTYKPESEISRLARGEIAESDCSPDVRYILALCDDLARTSDGYFDARYHRPDGLLDPSGVVKGWSIEEATWILDEAGAANYMINAGGDIVARGEPEPGHPWRIGIRHPKIADRLAGVLEVRNRAVATSGTYERGEHILDPHTRRPPTGMVSVTVVGPSLTYADAYATAAYAMGLPGLAWVAEHPGYDAYGITADERVLWTPGMDRYLVPGEVEPRP